jgi:hypothetical protein
MPFPALLLNPAGNKLRAKLGARLLALAAKKAMALGAAHAQENTTAFGEPRRLGKNSAALLR